jgi:hypothetical protein
MYPYETIRNLIDIESRVFHNDTGNWQTVPENELWRSTGVDYGRFANAALGVRALNELTAYAKIENVQIPLALRRIATRCSALIRLNKAGSVRLKLTITGDGAGEWFSNNGVFKNVRQNEWVLFDVYGDAEQGASSLESPLAKMEVEAEWSEETTDPRILYILNPVICVPQEAFNNLSAIESYVRIPEYMRDADSVQTDPDYPLYRFLDVNNVVSDDIDRKWFSFRYIPPEDNSGQTKNSSLVDPQLADVRTNIWLAQFLGIDLVDPRTGFTSWDALMAAADADDDGDSEWQEWNEAIGGEDEVLQWSEVEDFAIETVSSEALLNFIKWQLFSAGYGLRGGTTETITSTAKQAFLDPNGFLQIERHADGDPFKVHVFVSGENLKSGISGLQDLLDPATPAGYEVIAVDADPIT